MVHVVNKRRKTADLLKKILKQWQLYLLILLPLAYVIIFNYIPMGGIVIAFKNFKASKGIWGSKWVGLKYFEQFFTSPVAMSYLANTIILSLYSLLAGFPMPIILAVALNELGDGAFKKTVQMVTYAPYFISTVVLVGMIIQFFTPRVGAFSNLISIFTGQPSNLMSQAGSFRHMYVWSGVWQSCGYNAIVYIAALAGVDPSLYEAAIIDGASRRQKIWHIDIPSILPTIVILLILNCGNIMSVGFEKAYLMQNPTNLSRSEIISTYVYKLGLVNAQYSFSTAVGLFNSVVNLILLVTINFIAGKVNETTLW